MPSQEELVRILNEGKCKVHYDPKDNNGERDWKCTKNTDLIPEDQRKKMKDDWTDSTILVWVFTEKMRPSGEEAPLKDWRSMIVERIKGVERC